jgi:hypothetical protein
VKPAIGYGNNRQTSTVLSSKIRRSLQFSQEGGDHPRRLRRLNIRFFIGETGPCPLGLEFSSVFKLRNWHRSQRLFTRRRGNKRSFGFSTSDSIARFKEPVQFKTFQKITNARCTRLELRHVD